MREEWVHAIRGHVSRQVWATIELQLITGMRPGEACAMRGADLDTTGKSWVYKPAKHKTEHHGHARTIYLGARAQAVVKPFLRPDTQAHLVSPEQADAERRARLHERRKENGTPLSCGNRPGSNVKRKPGRKPQDHCTESSYRRPIDYACEGVPSAGGPGTPAREWREVEGQEGGRGSVDGAAVGDEAGVEGPA